VGKADVQPISQVFLQIFFASESTHLSACSSKLLRSQTQPLGFPLE